MIILLIGILSFTLLFGWVAYLILETGKWKYLVILFTPFFLIAWYIGFISCYFHFYYDYYENRRDFTIARDSLYQSAKKLETVPEIDSLFQVKEHNPVIWKFKKALNECHPTWFPPVEEGECGG